MRARQGKENAPQAEAPPKESVPQAGAPPEENALQAGAPPKESVPRAGTLRDEDTLQTERVRRARTCWMKGRSPHKQDGRFI